MAYETFVPQHIAAAAVLLWVLWVYVPTYASYNVWFAIGALSFDWVLRFLLVMYRNIRLRRGNSCNGISLFHHRYAMHVIQSMSLPRDPTSHQGSRRISRRIHRHAMKAEQTSEGLIGFIAGPYGVPPKWVAYETLILISASTGASFSLPILESILESTEIVCT